MALLGNLTGSSQFFNDTAFYNGVATQSLRLNDNDSANLIRSPSSAGDRQTFVWSGWVKRGNIDSQGVLFLAYNNINNNDNYFRLTFASDNTLKVNQYSSNLRITTQLFRDVSAWYHIVCAVDTHQATANNRILVYLNGVQITSFSTIANYSQDAVTGVNHTGEHRVGGSPSEYFDGYMAEVNFIDGLSFFSDTSGTANTSFNVNSFGETKNGVWIAKKYTGSYGTNGFRLQFNQTGVGTASTSTIGADTSGNTNHLTSSNIVASDCNMPDSPENNFATLNPLYYLTASTHLSEGNLQLTHETTAHRANAGTMFFKTGKWYFEVHNKSDTASGSVSLGVGLQDITKNLAYSTGDNNYIYYCNNNTPLTSLNTTTNSLGSFVVGASDIMQVAYDADSGKLFIGKNNTYVAADSGTDGNPATGANPTATLSTAIDYIPFVGTYNNEATANFGQDDTFAGAISSAGNTDGNGIGVFKYAPPSGYLALCTSNLPEPTISPNSATQADDYFNTVLYTGNATDDTAIAVDFQPDWVWIKKRSDAQEHVLFDSNRGATKRLFSNLTNAESDEATSLKAFTSSGFTLGSHSSVNDNTETFVAWNWKANGGTTSSNTDGSITSTVQANTTAGFSIVLWNGEGDSQATVGHGLGVTPQVIIPKNRGATGNWHMYHEAIDSSAPEDYGILLNATNARSNDAGFHNDTAPTSSVFTVGTYNNFDYDYVAYCFAEVEGYSKFGSYTGNGNADGPFVFLGLKPSFILIKRTDTAEDWWIYDNKRDTFNPNTQILYANANSAEVTGTGDNISNDFVSNGIKLRTANVNWNASGGTYIYMAFAEAPFKYANAR